MNAEYVYIARRADGAIKIGFSHDPLERMKNLTHATGQKVELLHHAAFSDALRVERLLHGQYSSQCVEGREWFNLSEDDLSRAAALLKTPEADLPYPVPARRLREKAESQEIGDGVFPRFRRAWCAYASTQAEIPASTFYRYAHGELPATLEHLLRNPALLLALADDAEYMDESDWRAWKQAVSRRAKKQQARRDKGKLDE